MRVRMGRGEGLGREDVVGELLLDLLAQELIHVGEEIGFLGLGVMEHSVLQLQERRAPTGRFGGHVLELGEHLLRFVLFLEALHDAGVGGVADAASEGVNEHLLDRFVHGEGCPEAIEQFGSSLAFCGDGLIEQRLDLLMTLTQKVGGGEACLSTHAFRVPNRLGSTPIVSATRELRVVAQEACACTACDLYAHATQTVFGDGPVRAHLFLVGEQPGDQEDKAGAPFVGPAGRLLDDALEQAGIARDDVYLTNAVKHFKWHARGKRRIHDTPNRTEVNACHGWLMRELELVEPDVVVALGATAGQSLWGPSFRVTKAHGQVLEYGGHPAVGTIHPSAVLRSDRRASMMDLLVSDLKLAASL